MKILLIGDVHSHYKTLQDTVNLSDADIILQVGDLGLFSNIKIAKEDAKAYKHAASAISWFVEKLENNTLIKLNKLVYCVKGNHDDYSFFETDIFENLGFRYIKNGTVVTVNGINILGFGGIYSPVRSKFPTKSLSGRNRRFFTEEDLAYAEFNANETQIHILLLHNAPVGVLPRHLSREEGLPMLNKLINIVKPEYIVHGHHHINYINNNVIGLGNFSKNHDSYQVINI